ncbi:MAG: aldehyde dehydrogenase family protein [Phycisphaeraceae bacterium]|nr:aldehyde dehydrogenase family protein [Phycisphaeraceae bacterium]
MLPAEAKRGQSGQPEPSPARRMLEKLGFKYHNRIDPFDGGPHLEAKTSDIEIVKKTMRTVLADTIAPDACTISGYASILTSDGDFRAVETPMSIDKQGRVRMPHDAVEALKIEPKDSVGITPIDTLRAATPPVSRARGRAIQSPVINEPRLQVCREGIRMKHPSLTREPSNLIGGRWIPAPGDSVRSFNPARPDQVVFSSSSSIAHLHEAVAAARAALPAWSSWSRERRFAVLQRFKSLVTARAQQIADLICDETGKAMWDSKGEVSALTNKVDITLDAT